MIQIFSNDLSFEQQSNIMDNNNANLLKLNLALDSLSLSHLKLVLCQFTKMSPNQRLSNLDFQKLSRDRENEYLQIIRQQSKDKLSKIVKFIFRDKLYSCISNFAYEQSRRLSDRSGLGAKSGGRSLGKQADDMTRQAREWLALEDLAREQIQLVDEECQELLMQSEGTDEQKQSKMSPN